MKKIASIAGISGLVLGFAMTAFAASPGGAPSPSADTMWRLEVTTQLEQARGPDVQSSAVESPRTRAINDLLNRIYRGDQVAPQEIDNALRR